MKVLRAIGFLFILELILAIHEYGHLTEMQKRNIEVQEFSLGIGPVLWQYPIGKMAVSVRAVPIMAYVLPTNAGVKQEKQLSFFERFLINSAGVRNNVLSGLSAVLILQFLGWRSKGLAPITIAKNVARTAISTIMLFIGFVVETFSFGYIQISDKFLLSIPLNPAKLIKQFIYWSFFVGFLNMLPFYPLDGGKIFVEVATIVFGNAAETVLMIFSATLLYCFLFIVGVSGTEFVSYE